MNRRGQDVLAGSGVFTLPRVKLLSYQTMGSTCFNEGELLINRLKMALDADQVAGNEEQERQGAMDFLRQQGVQINVQQIFFGRNLAPPEYLERFKAIVQDVVDGEGEEVR